MNVSIRCPDDSEYLIQVEKDDKLADLKKKVAEQSGSRLVDFDLNYEGNTLKDDECKVLEFGLIHPSELEMVRSDMRIAIETLGGAATLDGFINDISNGGSQVQLFLDAGIKPVRTRAVEIACLECLPDVVRLLASHYGTSHQQQLAADLELGLLAASSVERASDMIKVLINEFGVNVDCTIESLRTPLHIASRYGNLLVVKTLIALKADINKVCLATNTPLAEACLEGRIDVVDYLLQNGAASATVCHQDYNPLTLACQLGLVEIVSKLLPLCDINACDSGGRSPLIAACCFGRIDIVTALLEHNPRINAKGRFGHSPLFTAVKWNYIDIVEKLLQSGADVDQSTSEGMTSLLQACHSGNQSIVELLLKHDPDIQKINKAGDNALHIACKVGNPFLIRLLLDANCDHRVSNKVGKIPLHILCASAPTVPESMECLKMLVAANYSSILVNAKDIYGNTPLMSACMRFPDAVKFLLESGSDPSLKNSDGRTAIFFASAAGLSSVVTLLLNVGADVNIRDRSKKSPFTVAATHEIHKLLRTAKKRSST
eukprot:TRINITY_DN20674_c0_g1_i1.p1 TRINITY_DN20674_c0_g1~~TRINITY_DN20674_c0_g1_i1.p1  ORF type:complete len:546 (+),score=90.54 TRINITY_DN20674_c0_g1_i1:47-1684(+)